MRIITAVAVVFTAFSGFAFDVEQNEVVSYTFGYDEGKHWSSRGFAGDVDAYVKGYAAGNAGEAPAYGAEQAKEVMDEFDAMMMSEGEPDVKLGADKVTVVSYELGRRLGEGDARSDVTRDMAALRKGFADGTSGAARAYDKDAVGAAKEALDRHAEMKARARKVTKEAEAAQRAKTAPAESPEAGEGE